MAKMLIELLGLFDAAVDLVNLELLGVGVAQAAALPFLPEAREVSPSGEEVGLGTLQVLERLLQRVGGRTLQPRRLRAIESFGEQLAQSGAAQFLLFVPVALFLQGQCLVEDEAGRAHLALLFTGRHPLVLEGLEALHAGCCRVCRPKYRTAMRPAQPALNRGACGMPVDSEARQQWTVTGSLYVRKAGVLYRWGLRQLILGASIVAFLLHPVAGPVAAVLVSGVLLGFARFQPTRESPLG